MLFYICLSPSFKGINLCNYFCVTLDEEIKYLTKIPNIETSFSNVDKKPSNANLKLCCCRMKKLFF